MKKWSIFILLLLVGCLQEETVEEPYEVVLTGLDTPWAIDFLPDDTMIFTERPGRVSIFKDGVVTLIANIPSIERSEAGLLGIAVDPDFELTKQIFVYYTTSEKNVVSKFILEDDKLVGEEIIIDNIPNARFHDGGRIRFGPDNNLYITTGDATEPSSAQDIESLAGKILRITQEGDIPFTNPYENYVYSYGHRNPQGLAWDTEGQLYSSEHGPTRNDEFNKIELGKNYGWPNTQCTQQNQLVTNPIRCFSDFTLAPGSLEYFNGAFYIPGLRGTQLRRIILSNDQIVKDEPLLTNLGRIREVKAHKGYLYIATSNRDGRGIPKLGDDRIIRLKVI